MSYLSLSEVYKKFNDVEVVKNLSLDIEEGELVSFLGPSGCGKTTTLNMIAGFLEVDGGGITVNGKAIHHLPAHKRGMGMMFQNYALFPHMTVFENVAYGLKLRKVKKSEIGEKVREALNMTHLQGYEKRYPKEMSGGQQQRVALARALVIRPRLLLLDEPLSNLDAKLRVKMREEIVEIQKQVGITTIFVTHDQEEALAISDRIAVMNKGRIEQFDTPENTYNQPESAFVSRFIGEVNEFTGVVLEKYDKNLKIRLFGLDYIVPMDGTLSNKEVDCFIRPEKVQVSETKPDNYNSFPAKIEKKTFLGNKTRLHLRKDGQLIIADIGSISVQPEHIYVGAEINTFWLDEDLHISRDEV
ncbi:Fe3+/spermidine/putrescine ABC transporter ATP-binding protein [Oceanobacillus zhaokaii]|uniref:Spermidine/putrescine import ATP-binding protein PotA n=1 Tax=Oceanobacillus zhaokaii TaxID=2052660 RepID=A0A345PK75_9BACI|nr:ABC transporter ATP-binding protein [Oceanobacillus zhaokaii]AXI10405.1 Fe3+/spermidine/putrescine ABC transporter ATP-binding protein [Oceanobacillus zhaokaii]